MIQGIHAMVYTSDPEATRAFFRDKLKFPYKDAGGGWLIFDAPAAHIGCHPLEKGNGVVAAPDTWVVSLYCDDIHATVAELKGQGVEFIDDVTNAGYGLVTNFRAPGGLSVHLYQPLY